MGIEPTALCLGSRCSTTELRPLRADPPGPILSDFRDYLAVVSTEPVTWRESAQRTIGISGRLTPR